MAKKKTHRFGGRRKKAGSENSPVMSASNWTDEVPHPAYSDEEFLDTFPVREVKASERSELLSPVLTISDVCKMLGVSRWTLQRMEKAGSLPGRFKLGGQVRYHREIIEKWLLDQARK